MDAKGGSDSVSDGPDEATQDTQPAKGEPVKIPVPTRSEVLGAFRKVAKATTPDREKGSDPANP
jgi:hypothetical protein